MVAASRRGAVARRDMREEQQVPPWREEEEEQAPPWREEEEQQAPPWREEEVQQLLTVKFRQPSHEFTFGVGMTFVSYSLVLTPVV
jgi:hypothetical protein